MATKFQSQDARKPQEGRMTRPPRMEGVVHNIRSKENKKPRKK